MDESGGYENLFKNIQGAQIHKYNGGVIISASEYP
ncbi:hypothetical protein [Pseudocitrobacter vendiensis]|nr:hypothetical protein [Pseudocitrobacter vendiensis]